MQALTNRKTPENPWLRVENAFDNAGRFVRSVPWAELVAAAFITVVIVAHVLLTVLLFTQSPVPLTLTAIAVSPLTFWGMYYALASYNYDVISPLGVLRNFISHRKTAWDEKHRIEDK